MALTGQVLPGRSNRQRTMPCSAGGVREPSFDSSGCRVGLTERREHSFRERSRMYSPQQPAVILVIDDDALTLTGTAATLDAAGYECHCARDADAARKAARSLSLDL